MRDPLRIPRTSSVIPWTSSRSDRTSWKFIEFIKLIPLVSLKFRFIIKYPHNTLKIQKPPGESTQHQIPKHEWNLFNNGQYLQSPSRITVNSSSTSSTYSKIWNLIESSLQPSLNHLVDCKSPQSPAEYLKIVLNKHIGTSSRASGNIFKPNILSSSWKQQS